MTIDVTSPNLLAPYRVTYTRDRIQLNIDFHCAEIAQEFAQGHNGTITELFTGTDLTRFGVLWCETCGISHT